LEPSNIWLQCKACNAGSSKYARKGLTVSQGFREGLIERIGLEAVEALESDHEPRKHTIDELKAITATYRALTRELKRAAA
ncbi:recombination protein NinG, partial [Pseudomonas sp. 18092229]